MFINKKVAGLMAIFIVLLMVIPIWSRGCGGCGGRICSGSINLGFRGVSGSVVGTTHPGIVAQQEKFRKNTGAAFLASIILMLIFLIFRRRLGLHSYDPKKCKCPLADHVLNWKERFAFLAFILIPIAIFVKFFNLHPDGLYVCVIITFVYWFLDFAR